MSASANSTTTYLATGGRRLWSGLLPTIGDNVVHGVRRRMFALDLLDGGQVAPIYFEEVFIQLDAHVRQTDGSVGVSAIPRTKAEVLVHGVVDTFITGLDRNEGGLVRIAAR